jgi:predicted DNA-binding protein
VTEGAGGNLVGSRNRKNDSVRIRDELEAHLSDLSLNVVRLVAWGMG